MKNSTKELVEWIKRYIPNFQYDIEIINGEEYVECEYRTDIIGGITYAIDSLNLMGKNISKLPNNIGFIKCKSLILHNNNITELPESIGNLICKTLHLGENNITKLPQSIGSLKCINLYLHDNEIKEEDIKYIHEIEELKHCTTNYGNYEHDTLSKIKLLSKRNTRRDKIALILK